jgi:1-aminocyclopropane-1-carboxylate deaminase
LVIELFLLYPIELLFQHEPSPVEELHSELLDERGVRLFVKRDDRLQLGDDQAFCGNKWRKLKYNLARAREEGMKQLLTFGGAYSNHIAATASAGLLFGFQTTGVIRGEEHIPLNPTLRRAAECGMRLHYVERSAFLQKDDPEFIEKLHELFDGFYLIPEGGTNALALRGCEELAWEILRQTGDCPPDYFCLACGTGGTLAGLTAGLNNQGRVIGFPVLKGGGFLYEDIDRLLKNYTGQHFSNWLLNTDFHFGGYARFNPELLQFIEEFYLNYAIPLDPVYTGKLFFGIFELIRTGFFEKGSTILAIHTGGLQGIAGFRERFGW